MSPEKNTDQNVLLKILKGDESAWKTVVDEYSSLLIGIARRTFTSYGYPASNHDAEDAVANVWINLLENNCKIIKRCIHRKNFLQTLVVLTRNRAIDIMRKNKTIYTEFEEQHGGVTMHPLSETPSQPVPERILKKAISQLSEREKTIISLFFLQNLKYREIEALTGIPQNSIGPTINRALQHLRDFIKSFSSDE